MAHPFDYDPFGQAIDHHQQQSLYPAGTLGFQDEDVDASATALALDPQAEDEIVPEELSQTSNTDTERYIRGGNRDDFASFCESLPALLNKPIPLSRRGKNNATEMSQDDTFEVTFTDNGYEERYAKEKSKRSIPSTFKKRNGETVRTEDLPFAKWTIKHKVSLSSQMMTAHAQGLISNLTMFGRRAEARRGDENYHSWYKKWNAGFGGKPFRAGVWKFSKSQEEVLLFALDDFYRALN